MTASTYHRIRNGPLTFSGVSTRRPSARCAYPDGYQVLKKWLSYRERDVLGRALLPEEVLYFAEMARRIGEMLL